MQTIKSNKKLLLSAMCAIAVSSVQAMPVVLDSSLNDLLIVAETYSSQGAQAVIHGNIQSGTYTSVGAGITGMPTLEIAVVHGNINSGTYTSLGDSSIVDGSIFAQTYVTTGAFAEVGGNMVNGVGDVESGDVTTLGANSTVAGNVVAGGAFSLGAGATVGGSTSSNTATAPSAALNLQSNIQSQQAALKAMGGPPLVTGIFGASTSFSAGVYDVADILSFAADTDITLNGDGSDQSWVFNVGNYMSLGANVNVVLNNVGDNSSIIWNILGDSTDGLGLGYATLGAGVDFTGVILANTHISVGAEVAEVSGVGADVWGMGGSCGGLYSATSYVTVGATSIIGGEGCGVSTAVVPIPAAAWLFGSALIGLAGIKRKK